MRTPYLQFAVCERCDTKPYELAGWQSFEIVCTAISPESATKCAQTLGLWLHKAYYTAPLPMGFYDITETAGTMTLDGKCEPTKFYEVVPVPGGGRFPTADAAWNYLLSLTTW